MCCESMSVCLCECVGVYVCVGVWMIVCGVVCVWSVVE